jgi:acyl-CoA synthetase (AMP-forming)/AMP-acid ligase II
MDAAPNRAWRVVAARQSQLLRAPRPARRVGAARRSPRYSRVEGTLGVVLVEGYGLSEGSCASTLNPYDGVLKPGTVGLPLPGREVRVIDTEGNPLPCGERARWSSGAPT